MGLLTRPPGELGGDGVVYLWPCNVDAWAVWLGLQTQWRVGLAGATGLDYAGVRAELQMLGLPAKQQRELWPAIKECERAVLRTIAEVRAERERERQPPAGH